MKSVKVIAGFGFSGFLLSFFTGLAAGRKLGHVMIDAFIFLLVFAAIGAVIYFFAGKIIFSSSDSDSLSEVASSDASEGSHSGSHSVDILVEDEDLPDEENPSQFYVGSGHQMLNQGDFSDKTGTNSLHEETKNEQPAQNADFSEKLSSSQTQSGEFVPVLLGETSQNISGTEAKTYSEVQQTEQITDNSDQEIGEQQLGVLPDLEDIAGAPSAHAAGLEQTGDEDSSSSWNNTNSSASDASEIAEGKDAALMAKAISTLLAKDD